ncbi:hypothetical protein A3A70_00565 [candidate division WWE3 bacterium RIFCSPLOWO2_01_FULL_42_11]|uniref:Sortase n=1 Tax=candidate division WWE3 bacterium RIFCSPLOWO2_01_FULL_42_11 TaxID=1802627 RepID=A0A1F4VM71_UNCKA|nr:MAG: hypothetical protein A3A70_00565 [candidate division WWE3 bacterium RIFCSPLOWO2_01_FULL_42_11]
MPIKTYRKRTIEQKPKFNLLRSLIWMCSFILVFVGALFLALSSAPMFKSLASQTPFLKPVTNEYFGGSNFAFTELSKRQEEGSSNNFPSEFYLEIPNLGIASAIVQTNSISLSPDTFIGHLNGSSLPGELGQVVLYGHSTIPSLFNPENYKTIFSKLDELDSGDTIKLTYNDHQYLYTVTRSEIADPEDILKRLGGANRKELVLITCFPFGTTQKRLLVFGTLIGQ